MNFKRKSCQCHPTPPPPTPSLCFDGKCKQNRNELQFCDTFHCRFRSPKWPKFGRRFSFGRQITTCLFSCNKMLMWLNATECHEHATHHPANESITSMLSQWMHRVFRIFTSYRITCCWVLLARVLQLSLYKMHYSPPRECVFVCCECSVLETIAICM